MGFFKKNSLTDFHFRFILVLHTVFTGCQRNADVFIRVFVCMTQNFYYDYEIALHSLLLQCCGGK